MASSGSLGPTFGQWLLALFLQAILYGMGLLQVYLYFFWYHKDSWTIKASVIAITFFESFEMASYFSASYSYLIDGFGNRQNLRIYNWQTMAALLTVYLSTFVAQIYFAHCIYRLHQKSKVIPIIIVVLALACLGGGIGQVVRNIRVTGFPNLHETTATRTIQAVFALACDILITGALCWRLNQNRTGIQSTNTLLNYLIMTAVNRGVLTMITAALNIILFSAKPGTFYFMPGSSSAANALYMNSMLATLNTREYARGLHAQGEHVSMGTYRAAGGLSVSVTTETHKDNRIAPHELEDPDARDGKFVL
ncbi:hypothetical protein B0H10DRAFT_2217006 [Mycena sp. CBHHK59/15]|nr:hypothetical protein B0H10DRAFT_2217006 [Mycena sp. CBHHK59/15]